jgi:hypothetical protein
MSKDIADLSRGKLYIKRGDAPAERRFGESIQRRAMEISGDTRARPRLNRRNSVKVCKSPGSGRTSFCFGLFLFQRFVAKYSYAYNAEHLDFAW